jgi:hypothetical protein
LKQHEFAAFELMARVDPVVAAVPGAGQREGANHASSAIRRVIDFEISAV